MKTHIQEITEDFKNLPADKLFELLLLSYNKIREKVSFALFSDPGYQLLVTHPLIEKYRIRASEFAKWLDENIEEGFTIYQFPKEHQKKLRTSNGIERMNREIKRRTRVAILFPNKESALRLVTGVLVEIHEDWVKGKQYLNMNPL